MDCEPFVDEGGLLDNNTTSEKKKAEPKPKSERKRKKKKTDITPTPVTRSTRTIIWHCYHGTQGTIDRNQAPNLAYKTFK